jgi:hypothetical protein
VTFKQLYHTRRYDAGNRNEATQEIWGSLIGSETEITKREVVRDRAEGTTEIVYTVGKGMAYGTHTEEGIKAKFLFVDDNATAALNEKVIALVAPAGIGAAKWRCLAHGKGRRFPVRPRIQREADDREVQVLNAPLRTSFGWWEHRNSVSLDDWAAATAPRQLINT